MSFLVGDSISNVVVAKVELHLWQGSPFSNTGPIAQTSMSLPSRKVPSQSMHSTLLMTTGRFGGGPPASGCGGGGTGCLRAGGVAATGSGGGVSFAGDLSSLLPPMSDRSIGVGEGNIPPGVCWGEGFASVALVVGVCANRSRPGGGTPVRKNLIGEGVGGVRSFKRLLVMSARGGGVVGPFVGGGSTVGEVATVGFCSSSCSGAGGDEAGPIVEGGSLVGGVVMVGGACTGAGGSVDGPLSGRGSLFPSFESWAGTGFSRVAGAFITTSGRGGSGGAGRSGTGGRSADKASSSIPMMNRASCRREARTETFFRVRRRSTSRVEFRCDAEEIMHRTS